MFKNQPKGLIPAALSNMGERFGYYIMNAVLVLFLCSKFGLSEETSALVYPIDPAMFMMAASNQDFRNVNPYINSAFCSSCGVCEMYACPQSLAPRTLLADMKGGLRKAGIRPPQGVQPKPVQESREYRKVPEERLMARLGLTKYDKDAPLQEELVNVSKVKVLLSQHIGAPAQAIVNVGDMVTEGQMIAQPAQGLSVGIHATISGKVTEVTDRHVVIARN